MPKPRLRQTKAASLLKIAEELGRLALRLQWETRDVIDGDVGRLVTDVEGDKVNVFGLAKAIESGKVKIKGCDDDEPMPLFSREAPSETHPTPANGLAHPESPTVAEISVATFSEPPEPDDEGPTAITSLPGQLDLLGDAETVEILHEYEAHLEDNGDFPTFMGVVKAANLAEAKRLAMARYGDDLVEGTPILVRPCKAHLDGRFTEVCECVACGQRWPADKGVGCPKCVHEPIPAAIINSPEDLCRFLGHGDTPEASQSDPIATQSTEVKNHNYEVFRADDGTGQPALLGEASAASLADCEANVPDWFKAELIPGEPFFVRPGKAYSEPGIPYGTQMAECRKCGKRWRAEAGEVCEACGPDPSKLYTFEVVKKYGQKTPGHIQFQARNYAEAQAQCDRDWPGHVPRAVAAGKELANQKGSDGRPKTLPPAVKSWRDTPIDEITELECEFETAGQAWDLLETGALVGRLGWGPKEARALEMALVAIRAEAGDPAPCTAPMKTTEPPKPARTRKPSARPKPTIWWEVWDDSRDVQIDSVNSMTEGGAKKVAAQRHPGLRRLRVQRKEVVSA